MQNQISLQNLNPLRDKEDVKDEPSRHFHKYPLKYFWYNNINACHLRKLKKFRGVDIIESQNLMEKKLNINFKIFGPNERLSDLFKSEWDYW